MCSEEDGIFEVGGPSFRVDSVEHLRPFCALCTELNRQPASIAGAIATLSTHHPSHLRPSPLLLRPVCAPHQVKHCIVRNSSADRSSTYNDARPRAETGREWESMHGQRQPLLRACALSYGNGREIIPSAADEGGGHGCWRCWRFWRSLLLRSVFACTNNSNMFMLPQTFLRRLCLSQRFQTQTCD